MPRKPRNEVEPGIYHVTSRGTNRQDVFRADADRHLYLGRLAEVIRRTQWRCLAYCLMNNHLHLLTETVEPNLGEGMRLLNGWYGQRFNQRYDQVDRVFGQRFHAPPVDSDAYLSWVVGYIADNPVKAGFCAAPEAWRWSSHGVLTKGVAPAWLAHRRLLELLSVWGGDPERRYADCIAARGEARIPEPAR